MSHLCVDQRVDFSVLLETDSLVRQRRSPVLALALVLALDLALILVLDLALDLALALVVVLVAAFVAVFAIAFVTAVVMTVVVVFVVALAVTLIAVLVAVLAVILGYTDVGCVELPVAAETQRHRLDSRQEYGSYLSGRDLDLFDFILELKILLTGLVQPETALTYYTGDNFF